jgi:ubiquinone biosynthesis UbiH/UbiF/VisC/COQ6 family hydroxylase
VTNHDYDVLIVGGGVAGLACACLLRKYLHHRRPAVRIGVVESQAPRPLAADAETGLRVLAIAPATRVILEACGAWQLLPAGRAAPYERMRVWQTDSTVSGPGSIGFDAADSGLRELGHIVEHDWLRQSLWQVLAEDADGPVTLLTDADPAALLVQPADMAVHRAGGTVLHTRLLVGADGADSWVREQLRLTTTGREYGQSALVAHVSCERSHERTAWQCFTRGGPVALLPLADGRCSLVWSCPEAEARELAALPDDEFGARLTAATGSVLGTLRPTTRRLAFPLAARHTHRYTGPRFALIGDAAHQIHPLAGQGINLGLRDAAVLADTLASHLHGTRLADPGDALVLRRYERARKGDNLLTMGAMEGLHRMFTSDSSALTRLATAALGAVDRLPAVKRLLTDQATGSAPIGARDQHESV